MRQTVAELTQDLADRAATLRALTDADRPFLASLRRNLKLQSLLLTVPNAIDDAAVEQWIERRCSENGGCFLLIEDHQLGKPAGYVQITQVHLKNATGYGGIVLAEEARGRGFGRTALEELARHAKFRLGLRKLLAEVRSDNVASLKLHTAVGYREIGTLEDHFTDAESRAHDVVLLERRLEEL